MKIQPIRRLAAFVSAAAILAAAEPASAHIRLTRQQTTPTVGPVVQAHWLDSELPLLSVIDATNNDISYAQALAVVQASAETWENVNTAYFTVNPVDVATHPDAKPAALDATDGQNSVFFDRTGTNFPTAGVIAFVRSIVDLSNGHTLDADMVFNDVGFFSSTTDPVTAAPAGQSAVDLQSVITHEYGHYFGLDHTSVGQSTMIPFIITNSTLQRTLELDDRAGISSIFPESASRPGGLSPGAVDFFATTGTVSGTVVAGFTGRAVFGAHVEAINIAAPSAANTISAISGELTLRQGRGDFTIRGLPPGSYAIRIVPLDGIHTVASDGNIGGVFNGLDVNFDVEFWNGAGENGNGFQDPADDFTPVAVAGGADAGGIDFQTNLFPGRVIVAQHGQFESTVTFTTNNQFLAVRFDLPFEPPYRITRVEFPSFIFSGTFANFPSIRLVPMNPANGLPDLANPLFSQAPFAGSPNGVNSIPLDITVNEANRTLFWLMQFPPGPNAAPNFPFIRMDFTNMERGLFANSYVVGSTGAAAALLFDRNLAASLTAQLSGSEVVPIEASQGLGANRRATQTEFFYTRPGDVRLDGLPTEQNALDHVELVSRTALGASAVLTPVAMGGAGTDTIHLEPSPSSTAQTIWSTRAVDKSGRRSLTSSVTITGPVTVGAGATAVTMVEDADEGNGRLNEATPLATPATRTVSYWPAGDRDYFEVIASPGQVIDVKATALPTAPAPQDGSNPLDLTMILFDHKGAVVAVNDDTFRLDPRITYTVPAGTGEPRRFRVLVTDFEGGPFDPASAPRVKTPVAYSLEATVTTPPPPPPAP